MLAHKRQLLAVVVLLHRKRRHRALKQDDDMDRRGYRDMQGAFFLLGEFHLPTINGTVAHTALITFG